MLCPLQEDSHKHKSEEEIQSPRKYEKNHYKKVLLTERRRASCDEKHLAEGIHNIQDVFVANGYPRETVTRFMEQRPQSTDRQKRARRTRKLWKRDYTICKRVV